MRAIIDIDLTNTESAEAEAHGRLLRQLSIDRAYREMNGTPVTERLQRQIEGAYGERVYRKAFNLPWPPPIDTFKGPDADRDVQVRFNNYPSNPHLVHRPRDNPEHRYVLVVGRLPSLSFQIHGWWYGHQCRQPQFWGDMGRPDQPSCWWVPARLLNRDMTGFLDAGTGDGNLVSGMADPAR